jgi:NMD3 family
MVLPALPFEPAEEASKNAKDLQSTISSCSGSNRGRCITMYLVRTDLCLPARCLQLYLCRLQALQMASRLRQLQLPSEPAATATYNLHMSGFGEIKCCLCGKSIPPNAAALCGECLRTEVDITDSIPEKGLKLFQCRKCLRWQGKNEHYVPCQLESVELLALCLKRIPGLGKQELVDAAFVWTEPHSMRVKVKLTLKRDVLNGVLLQQTKIVEFLVQWRQCR